MWTKYIGVLLNGCALMISLLALYGYATDHPAFYWWRQTPEKGPPMAVNTALCLFLFGLGVIFLHSGIRTNGRKGHR